MAININITITMKKKKEYYIQQGFHSDLKKRWKVLQTGFPSGTVVGSLPASAGDTGLIPGPGRSHMPQSNWACAPQLPSPTMRCPHTARRSNADKNKLKKKSSTDKQKLSIQHHKINFTRIVNGTSLSKKQKTTTSNMKIMNGKISLVHI